FYLTVARLALAAVHEQLRHLLDGSLSPVADLHGVHVVLRSQLVQRPLAADRLQRHPRLELRTVLLSCRRHRPLLSRPPTPKLTYCVVQILGTIISVVLLKNDKNFLPLDKKSLKSIAVIGPLADSVHWDWYGGTPPYAVTPLQGIKEELGPDVTINYASDELGNAAVNAARKSDVAIVVVGNDPTCGPDMRHDWYSASDGGGVTLPCTVPSDGREGRDRETIDLYQEQLIKQVYAANPKTVVILVSSFPFAINWTQANIPAILHMTHASQDEGTAL